MVVGRTPFGSRQSIGMDAVCDNIRLMAATSYKIAAKLSARTTNTAARDFVMELLETEPSKRLGMASGGASGALNHEFFDELPISALKDRSFVAPYVPPVLGLKSFREEPAQPPMYCGNQAAFESF